MHFFTYFIKDHNKKYEFDTTPLTTFKINFFATRNIGKAHFLKTGNFERRANVILVIIFGCKLMAEKRKLPSKA